LAFDTVGWLGNKEWRLLGAWYGIGNLNACMLAPLMLGHFGFRHCGMTWGSRMTTAWHLKMASEISTPACLSARPIWFSTLWYDLGIKNYDCLGLENGIGNLHACMLAPLLPGLVGVGHLNIDGLARDWLFLLGCCGADCCLWKKTEFNKRYFQGIVSRKFAMLLLVPLES
jgi:hypothetical protein